MLLKSPYYIHTRRVARFLGDSRQYRGLITRVVPRRTTPSNEVTTPAARVPNLVMESPRARAGRRLINDLSVGQPHTHTRTHKRTRPKPYTDA